MLSAELTSILDVSNASEYLAAAVSFARRSGFDKIAATAVLDSPDGKAQFNWVDNAPDAYRETAEYSDSRDPVSQHCKKSALPIVWNQQTYVSSGQAAKWEVQARFGYAFGVAHALHLPNGRHFFIGIDRDQPLPNDAATVTRIAADLQLFAVFAQEAAFRLLFTTTSTSADLPNLTVRELESLRWTIEGKTAWELGRILGISEQTAARHVNNAMHKLGCVSKHQAAVRALRLGLIR